MGMYAKNSTSISRLSTESKLLYLYNLFLYVYIVEYLFYVHFISLKINMSSSRNRSNS